MCFAPTHNFQTYGQQRILTTTSMDIDIAATCSYGQVFVRDPIRPILAEFPTMSQAIANPSRALTCVTTGIKL